MSDLHAFTYAGFPLSGVDEFGSTWSVVKMSGWTDGVNIRAARQVKAGQDGEWGTAPLRSAREVTVMGTVEALSHAALEQSQRAFTGLPLIDWISGTSDEGTLEAGCYLSAGQKFEHQSEKVAVWALSVVAPDPLLYGPPVTLTASLAGVAGTGRVWPRAWPRDWGVPAGQTPGSVNVPNGGTAPYWSTLRIDGPVINPVVTLNETGDWVRINRTVLAGQWLDIDCRNRSVLLNGTVSLAAAVTSSGRWLGIPVGGGSLSYNADSADAAAVLTINGFEGAFS